MGNKFKASLAHLGRLFQNRQTAETPPPWPLSDLKAMSGAGLFWAGGGERQVSGESGI